MSERNINEGEPKNLEMEPINSTLRRIAIELGFSENPELQEIERRAVGNYKSTDTENVEGFTALMVEFQRVGEAIANQEDNLKSGLPQIGLLIVRAAVLFESGRLEDSRDEVYDIKTELDNYTPAEYPEVSDRTQELLTLYEAIKKEIAQEIEVKENLPPFETIRNIAVAELGPVDTLSYQEALVQMQKIAEQEGISNPLLIIVVQDASMQEFVLNQAEAEFQWEGLAEYYEDDKELSMPVALVVDGSKHHF